jgi:Spy/CpxP family protein refolding chaperone
MNVRTLSALFSIPTVALCGSLVLAQPPAPAAPQPQDAPSATQSPAPVERAPRPPRPMESHGRQFSRPGMDMQGHRPMDGMMQGDGMGFRSGPRGMWWKDANVVQQLNLTPEQIKRMDGIFEQSRLQLIDLRANLQKQEIMLEPMLSANPVDAAKASAQIDKVAQARADLEKSNAKMLLGIRGVLTPEQWTKLNERHGRHGRGNAAERFAPPAPGAGPGRGPGYLVAPPPEF